MPSAALVAALATRRLSAQKLSAMGDMLRAASSKGTAGGAGRPSSRAASSITTALSAGSSSTRCSTRSPRGGAVRMAARTASAMSSRWMRLKAWPGRRMRRAVPARSSSKALRPGP